MYFLIFAKLYRDCGEDGKFPHSILFNKNGTSYYLSVIFLIIEGFFLFLWTFFVGLYEFSITTYTFLLALLSFHHTRRERFVVSGNAMVLHCGKIRIFLCNIYAEKSLNACNAKNIIVLTMYLVCEKLKKNFLS